MLNQRLQHFFTKMKLQDMLNQWFSNLFKISTLRSAKIFSITHGPLFLSINSGSAARSSSVADVKYMDISNEMLCALSKQQVFRARK